MPRTEKVAISLPIDLFRRIERMRRKTGETRSAFIRRSLERAFLEGEREKNIKAYVEGYEKFPETEEEIADAEAMSGILSRESW